MHAVTIDARNNDTTIRDLIAEREAAMRGKDAARLIAHYAADVVKFDLAPPLRNAGPSAVDPAGLQAWFDAFDGQLEYAVHDLAVVASAELAFCHSLNRLSAAPRGSNGFHFTLWYRATLCLRKVEGRWLIAHEHNSTPFYIDGSLRAAVDLEP